MIAFNIEAIVREINKELSPQFEEALRYHPTQRSRNQKVIKVCFMGCFQLDCLHGRLTGTA